MNTQLIRTSNITAERVAMRLAYNLTFEYNNTQRSFRLVIDSPSDATLYELPGENTPLEGAELEKVKIAVLLEFRPSTVYVEHLYRLGNPEQRDPALSEVPAKRKAKKEWWVKTYEEACEIFGIDPLALPDVSMLPGKHRKSVIAYIKLVTIIEALNEGWIPDFSNSKQDKYFPFFITNRQANGDTSIAYKDNFISNDFVELNSRLYCRTSHMAQYVGQHFTNLYHEYLMV